MTAKNITFHENIDETADDIISANPKIKSGRRKARKQKKKKLDRSDLTYYYEDIATSSLPGRRGGSNISTLTRLSDLGFTTGNQFASLSDRNRTDDYDDHTYSKYYYENYDHLSAKEKQTFDSKFTAPKNPRQIDYVAALKNPKKKIVICSGPAGTGKTLFATEYGIRQFLTGGVEKLIFTRPSVSVDEDLGFLPGSLEDKMAPWIRPIYDILYEHLSPSEVTSLIEEKLIEIAPLGYMRGRTFKNAWIVADEMQNSTVSQMKMLLTRLGENSRIIVTGDLEQFDRIDGFNGLEDFLSKFREKSLHSKPDSIVSFQFDKSDIQREEVVKEVLDIYS